MTVFRVEKLQRHHAVESFDCGTAELNRFLIRFALTNQLAGASQTYLGLADEAIAGFYTLVTAQVEYDDAPERLTKGLAHHPVPLILLARLATATSWQEKGVGSGLLKDAMKRTLQVADIVRVRAFAVHAKDEAARTFYQHFDFIPSPTDPLHLFLLIKDLRRIVGN